MNKRPKKRFTSEDQIIARIDKCLQLSEELDKKAASREVLFKRLNGTEEEYRCEELWQEVCRLRVKSKNLREKKAKGLGEKLAEFRTGILVAVDGEDGSVPV
jgi:predicted nucleic acid-binding protein